MGKGRRNGGLVVVAGWRWGVLLEELVHHLTALMLLLVLNPNRFSLRFLRRAASKL